MVVESDESDGSFLRLPAVIAVVTNVDPEHLDHYGTFDALRDAFVRFVENIPFYGFAVVCLECLQDLAIPKTSAAGRACGPPHPAPRRMTIAARSVSVRDGRQNIPTRDKVKSNF